MRNIVLIVVLLCSVAASAEENLSAEPDWCDYAWDAENQPVPPRLNLPRWVCEVVTKRGLAKNYSPMVDVNPFFLTGDFDGDHQTDIAIWIKNKRTGQYGLAIIHYRGRKLFLIGAGNPTEERGSDLNGLDMWTLIPKGRLESPYEEKAVTLVGDAILLTKSDSASVALYWNGKTYAWFQISD